MTTSLEEHIAYHAQAIDDISAQMAEQWEAMRRLEAKMDRIIDHLRAMQEDDGGSGPSASTPPPHY